MADPRTDLPSQIVWDVEQTAAALGINSRTLQRLAETGEGPPRLQLSLRRVGYLRSDVQSWLEQRRTVRARAA
jgi:predicted DNA-binding transcriptional regulator AlpA